MISVGIDIGSSSVKVARIEGSTKGFRVIALEEYPLTSDPTKDTTLDIIEILRDAVARHGSDGECIVLGAEQSHASVRNKVFPFRERHKILKSLPFELEEEIPLSMENAIYEAKITHFRGGKAHVLAVAASKEHIEKVLSRAHDCGFEPAIISLDAFALANLFEGWPESPPELPAQTDALAETQNAQVILHLGHKRSLVLIMNDRRLIEVFSMDWGGKDFVELLASKYNLQYIEALKELKNKGFVLTSNEGAGRDQIAFSDIIKSGLDPLANKLKLVIAGAEANHQFKIRQVQITGGVSQLRNLGPYLTQKLEVVSNRLTQVEDHPECDVVANPKNELAQLVAIGLAAEGLKRPKNPPLNLLKGELAKSAGGLTQTWTKWRPIALPALGIFAAFWLWSMVRVGISSELLSTADSRIRIMARDTIGLKGSQLSLRNIQKYILEQNSKLKQREMLESLEGIESSLDMFKNISALAPSKSAGLMNVTNLKVRTNEVEIHGSADKNDLIEKFRKALAPLAAGGQVTLTPSGESSKPGFKAFTLKFKTIPLARKDN